MFKVGQIVRLKKNGAVSKEESIRIDRISNDGEYLSVTIIESGKSYNSQHYSFFRAFKKTNIDLK